MDKPKKKIHNSKEWGNWQNVQDTIKIPKQRHI